MIRKVLERYLVSFLLGFLVGVLLIGLATKHPALISTLGKLIIGSISGLIISLIKMLIEGWLHPKDVDYTKREIETVIYEPLFSDLMGIIDLDAACAGPMWRWNIIKQSHQSLAAKVHRKLRISFDELSDYLSKYTGLLNEQKVRGVLKKELTDRGIKVNYLPMVEWQKTNGTRDVLYIYSLVYSHKDLEEFLKEIRKKEKFTGNFSYGIGKVGVVPKKVNISEEDFKKLYNTIMNSPQCQEIVKIRQAIIKKAEDLKRQIEKELR